MTMPAGWRVPYDGGVAHFFVPDGPDDDRPSRPLRTLCGKVRRQTSYFHPIHHGVEADWRPCRDCFGRVTTILKDVEVEA